MIIDLNENEVRLILTLCLKADPMEIIDQTASIREKIRRGLESHSSNGVQEPKLELVESQSAEE